jgi:hypothetical protein
MDEVLAVVFRREARSAPCPAAGYRNFRGFQEGVGDVGHGGEAGVSEHASIIVLRRRFLHHDLALPPDRDVLQCAYRPLLWAMARLDMPPGHS